MGADLRVGEVIAVVEAFLALTLGDTRGVFRAEADEHHRVTNAAQCCEQSVLVATVGLAEREDRFHRTGIEIFRANEDDVLGTAGVTTQVDGLARVVRGPAGHPQR